MEGTSGMKDAMEPGTTHEPEALDEERSEFSHRLASFGLGEKPARLLEDVPRNGRPATGNGPD